jgi:hypothetical protein
VREADAPAAIDDELARQQPRVVDERPPLLAALALELGADVAPVYPELLGSVVDDLRRLALDEAVGVVRSVLRIVKAERQ